MNGRPSSISFSRVCAAISAASYACAGGSCGQRCLAITSALTNTLRGSTGASVSSTKVDLPAPLGPATRSSRFTRRVASRTSFRVWSPLAQHDRGAVGTVFDHLALVVEGDCGDAAPGQHPPVVGDGEAFLDGRGYLGIEHHALFLGQFGDLQLSGQGRLDLAPGRAVLTG